MPVVALAGTCMEAGKTAAACAVIARMRHRGLTIDAFKATGVSLRRDILAMEDAGARRCAIFTDLGVVTTTRANGPALTRTMLTELTAGKPDAMVFELGDGILGTYGVDAILECPDIRSALTGVMLSANDPVAAWGGVKLLRERFGIEPCVVTGPATDNQVGVEIITAQMGVPAFNALTNGAALGDRVIEALGLKPARAGRAMTARVPAMVLGGTGYVAGELLRLLAAHPHFKLAAVMSESQPGEPVAAAFPHLAAAYPQLRFRSEAEVTKLLCESAVSALFSAAPHGVSAALVDRLLTAAEHAGTRPRVVDISADYRYATPEAYTAVYAHSHAAPGRLREFTCAVPEHLKELTTNHVGHPGCFATALLLASVPLLARELVEPDAVCGRHHRQHGLRAQAGGRHAPSAAPQ